MKILVIGGDAFFGKKIVTILSKDHKVISSHHIGKRKDQIEIDLERKEEILPKIKEIKPDIIIVVAALNSIEGCEKNKELAWKINVESLEPLIKYSKDEGTKLVFLSSCAVFDGGHPPYKKHDLASPISFYGVTKLIGENMIRRDLENYLIIRSDSFYGYNDDNDRPTFPIEVIKILGNGKTLEVDNKRVIYPTWIDDLAFKIKVLIEHDKTGIFQITGEYHTHYSFALSIADVFGLDEGKIKEKTRTYFLRPKDGGMVLDYSAVSVKEGLILMGVQMERNGK